MSESRLRHGSREEICDEYKIALEKGYNIEDKAVQAFEFVINKAREFQIVNQWTQKPKRLNETNKTEWPLQCEEIHRN